VIKMGRGGWMMKMGGGGGGDEDGKRWGDDKDG